MKYLYNYLFTKISLITFILFLLFSPLPNAQIEWIKLPQPYGGSMGAIYSAAGDTVFAAVNNTFYISTDGGVQWRYSGVESKFRFRSFVHTDDNKYFANCYEGLYKSIDLINWSYYEYDEYEDLTRDIAGNIYGFKGSSLLMSTDNLTTWKQLIYLHYPDVYFPMIFVKDDYVFVTGRDGTIYRMQKAGPFARSWDTLQTAYINPFRLAAGPGSIIYAVSDYPEWLGITSDYGNSWTYTDLTQFFIGIGPRDIAVIDSTILVCGSQWDDTTRIFLYRSTDLGLTWQTANAGLPPKSTVTSITNSGENIYAGTWGAGVYKSTDRAKSWLPAVKGLSESSVDGVVFTDDGSMFASVFGQGILKSTDKGASWRIFNKGLNNANTFSIVQDSDGDLYAVDYYNIFRLADHHTDSSWIKKTAPSEWYARLWTDKQGRIYAKHTNGILVSANDGSSWSSFFGGDDSWGFLISRSGNAFVSKTNYQQIYKSTDSGQHWSVNFNAPSNLSNIVMDNRGYLYVASYDGVFRTTNDGSSWTFIQNGLTDYNVHYVFADETGNVYCSAQKRNAYTHHLFHSSDMGDHWQMVTGNLNLSVYEMGFRNETIYLFTNKGIWVNSNSNVTAIYNSEQSVDFTLQQNYPNPFNPTTTIEYSVPQISFVTIKIYDILGNEIETLVNEEKPAGRYEISWNAVDLPSGVYFYQLRAGSYTDTKKIILMK